MSSPRVVNAFLSHSYGAPAVNLFFQQLVSTVAAIAFRVDRGKFHTSTTRLERMIRDADAFIGVWPLPGDPGAHWDRDGLVAESRYFRLELDMAIRARKPGIVFSDRRYGNLLPAPSGVPQLRYDPQEIALESRSPSWARLQARVADFWRNLEPRLAAPVLDPALEEGRVGVLLASGGDVDAAGVAAEMVAERALEPVLFADPPRLSPAALAELRRCDWAIVDIADQGREALAAFLHGQFVPVLRLHREAMRARPSAVEETLFGTLEVGYRKTSRPGRPRGSCARVWASASTRSCARRS